MAAWKVLGSALTATLVVSVSAGATPQRTAACPTPKPLPASLKRPPAGASATQLANFLLALPQRKPCDVNLFTTRLKLGDTNVTGLYPEGSPSKAAVAGQPAAEAAVRAQLDAFLAGQLSGNRTRVMAALALFDRADVREKVPDPTLRAALVSLSGTLGRPLLEWFVTSRKVQVRWGGTPGTASVGSGQIVFNRRYNGEHFALLSGVFAHEILHWNDGVPPPTEEVILHVVNIVVYMQLLRLNPELATSGTELARQKNSDVLVFINSRSPGSSRSAIIVPTGRGTAPGSTRNERDIYQHAKYYHGYGWAAKPEDSSPAPPVFATVLRSLLAPGVKIPKPLTYSKKTAELFSKMNDTWLSPVDRLRVSVLLGLVSMEEIVKYTGLPRAKAIATFRLAPILAAMK